MQHIHKLKGVRFSPKLIPSTLVIQTQATYIGFSLQSKQSKEFQESFG